MNSPDFNDAPVGIAMIGVDRDDCGRVIRANRTLAALVASMPEELAERSMCDLIHERNRAYAIEQFAGLIGRDGGSCEGEGRLVAKDGRIGWVRVHAGLFPTDGIARAVVMLRFAPIAELTR
jgi:PAS domain S-box-containing protein